MLLKQATPQVGRSIQALETERIKTEFFAKQSCGIQFDYDTATRTISVTDHTDTLPFASRLYDAADTEKFTIFSKDDLNRLENALSATTRDAPDVSMPITLRFPEVGWEHEYSSRLVRSGRVTPSRGISALSVSSASRRPISCCRRCSCRIPALSPGRQLADSMQGMSRIFDVVRLVDPKRGENPAAECGRHVLGPRPAVLSGVTTESDAADAFPAAAWRKRRMSKLELTDECAYQLISRYLVVDGRECVLELGSRISDSVWVTSGGRQFRLDASHGEDFLSGSGDRRVRAPLPRGPAARAGKGGGAGGDRQ